MEASKLIRNFVWSIPISEDFILVKVQFKQGEQNCALELLEVFFNNMSSQLRSLISSLSEQAPRSFICSENFDHSKMEYRNYPYILNVNNSMRDSLSAERSSVGEKELDEEFNSVFFYQTVLQCCTNHLF